MKLKLKIFLLIISLILSSIISMVMFFVFFNDPFLKLAPEDSKIYGFLNLNNYTKEKDNQIFNLKNIYINKIFEDKNIKSIFDKNISKSSLFINGSDDIFIFFRYRLFKKVDNQSIDEKYIEKLLKNNLNFDKELYKIKLNNYTLITSDKNYIEKLKTDKFKFLIKYYSKIFKENEIGRVFNKDIFSIFIYTDYIKNKGFDLFNKDYSFVNLYKKNYYLNLDISNNKKIISDIDSYSLNLEDNYLYLSNINIYDFYNKLVLFFNEKNNLESKENINFFNKNINEIEYLDSIKNIFNNNSNIYIEFKNSKTSFDNIKNFAILSKLENINNYENDIKNIEKIFLKELASSDPRLERVVLPDGTMGFEEKIDFSKISFNLSEINNNNKIRYLDLKNYSIYYLIDSEDSNFIISNSKDFIEKIIKKDKTNNIFKIKNINLNISAFENDNNISITIK